MRRLSETNCLTVAAADERRGESETVQSNCERRSRLSGQALTGHQKHLHELVTDVTLVLEHSVEADVSLAFAWRFRTNVANWNDPPATFVLNGAFVDGSQGSTALPGQAPVFWWIRDVDAGRSFAIEMPLDRATLRFEWYFDVAAGGGTKLTQRIVLSGINAAAYREQVEAGFRPTLADGMRRLAADMVAAERDLKDAG